MVGRLSHLTKAPKKKWVVFTAGSMSLQAMVHLKQNGDIAQLWFSITAASLKVRVSRCEIRCFFHHRFRWDFPRDRFGTPPQKREYFERWLGLIR